MKYNKTNWTEETPITATLLNNLEDGVVQIGKEVEEKLSKDGGTISGNLNVGNVLTAKRIALTDYGTPAEIGQFLDFHKSGSTTDYDARLSIDSNSQFHFDKNINLDNTSRVTARFNPIYLGEGSNLNNLTNTGMYYCNLSAVARTMTNVPEGVAFSLLIEENSGCTQTFTTYESNGFRVYKRGYYSETGWGAWVREPMVWWGTEGSRPSTRSNLIQFCW